MLTNEKNIVHLSQHRLFHTIQVSELLLHKSGHAQPHTRFPPAMTLSSDSARLFLSNSRPFNTVMKQDCKVSPQVSDYHRIFYISSSSRLESTSWLMAIDEVTLNGLLPSQISAVTVMSEMMEDTARTFQRVYEWHKEVFIKRELRPHELEPGMRDRLMKKNANWDSRARLENEYKVLKYIAENTDIPVPTPISFVEDDEIGILTVARVDKGLICLSEVKDNQQAALDSVTAELTTKIIPQLQSHTSQRLGGFDSSDLLLLTPRMTDQRQQDWHRVTSDDANAFVLCHNDLGQHNIFIDPETFAIKYIVDWEYAGFYLPKFEADIWKNSPRKQDWEGHDLQNCRDFLDTICGTVFRSAWEQRAKEKG
ncbi:hypothetical protein MRB53_042304 [Persea americana]|nr:hypothetical protein MRB53_042304 [Persea americana]